MTRLTLVLGLLAPTAMAAKPVEIADTGFRLTVPDHYNVSRPAGAPDILVQCDRPDGNGSIQVVRANPGEPIANIAAAYEAKMQQALANFTRQSAVPRMIAGRPGEFRTYQSLSGKMNIRVLAAFYQDGSRAFTVHSLDTTGGAAEFETAVCSLTGPVAVPVMKAAAGAVALGDTGFVLEPPPGWQPFPSTRPDGLQFGLPDKSALLEALWPTVDMAAPSNTVLLEQTLTQLESSIGAGWTERERMPRVSAGTNLLFKRFGGQIGGVPAELLVCGVTDGSRIVLAFGYYAETAAGTAGAAMRRALLSLKRPSTATEPAINMALSATLPAAPAKVPDRSGRAPATPPPAPVVNQPDTPLPAGFAYYSEATTGLDIPHPAGWVVEKAAGSVTLSGREGTPAYNTTISVQALRRSDPANRDLATAVKSFSQGLASSGAQIKSTEARHIAAGAAHHIHAAAKIGHAGESGFTHLFRYVLVERPAVIAVISYVSPIDDWNGFLPTVDQSVTGIRVAGATVAAPTAGKKPSAGVRTSVDAWKTLNGLAKAKDWEMMVEFLEPEAVRQHLLPRAEDLARRAGFDASSLSPEPRARLRAFLEQVPAAAECVEYLQRDDFKISTREENAEQHLVMVQHGSGANQQTYYWMRRINGRWLHTPN